MDKVTRRSRHVEWHVRVLLREHVHRQSHSFLALLRAPVIPPEVCAVALTAPSVPWVFHFQVTQGDFPGLLVGPGAIRGAIRVVAATLHRKAVPDAVGVLGVDEGIGVVVLEVVAAWNVAVFVPGQVARTQPSDVGAGAFASIKRVANSKVHTLGVELGCRLHGDDHPLDSGDVVSLGASGHHLVVQIPHHSWHVRNVHVSKRVFVVILGSVNIEFEDRR
mmetsp:Transcript_60198/g.127519  ORF Transcript_60198/g.127519 Transcript_60198/m.127519 type:complete len:220 (+) Transcript_60198:421-1080(+)